MTALQRRSVPAFGRAAFPLRCTDNAPFVPANTHSYPRTHVLPEQVCASPHTGLHCIGTQLTETEISSLLVLLAASSRGVFGAAGGVGGLGHQMQ